MQERILFGTYTKKTSQGIYVGTLHTTANTLNFKESSNESLSSGLLFGELVKLLSGQHCLVRQHLKPTPWLPDGYWHISKKVQMGLYLLGCYSGG